jgi:hypothetical protein
MNSFKFWDDLAFAGYNWAAAQRPKRKGSLRKQRRASVDARRLFRTRVRRWLVCLAGGQGPLSVAESDIRLAVTCGVRLPRSFRPAVAS